LRRLCDLILHAVKVCFDIAHNFQSEHFGLANPAQAEDTLGQPLGCADLLHILSANPLCLHTLRRCPARER
jgi:hypothetical protein